MMESEYLAGTSVATEARSSSEGGYLSASGVDNNNLESATQQKKAMMESKYLVGTTAATEGRLNRVGGYLSANGEGNNDVELAMQLKKEMALTIRSLSVMDSEPVQHLLQAALKRGASAYKFKVDNFAVTDSQFLILAILEGLVKEDVPLCKLLMEASRSQPQLNSPTLADWLRHDFSFGEDCVSNAQRQLQKLIRKGDLSVPGCVYAVIMLLGNEASLFFYSRLSNVASLSSRDIDSDYSSSEPEDGLTDLKYLFEELSPDNDEDYFKINQLSATIGDNKPEVETSLIIAGEGCNKPYSKEQTFQEIAFIKRIKEAWEKKLEHEENLTNKDEGEDLLRAIRCKDTLAVKASIQAGVNVNVKSKTGDTPLHLAAYVGDEKIIRTLLDAGASVKMENDEWYTALHLASSGCAVYAIVSFGADINHKGLRSVTPLHLAVNEGNLEIVKALIVMGASTKEQDANGDTVLHIAARTDDIEMLMELLKADNSLKARNNIGDTALHIAARTENVDMVKELIVAGANIEAKDIQGYTVTFSAALRENLPVLLMLCNLKADLYSTDLDGSTIMHALVKKGSIEVINWLLEKGYDVDRRDMDGRTPLHLAVELMDRRMAQVLMKNWADVNAILDKKTRKRPLHMAVENWDVRMAMELIDFGANVNKYGDKRGYRPLHTAIDVGDGLMVRKLLDRGAKVCFKDFKGRKPLDLAISKGNSWVEAQLRIGYFIQPKVDGRAIARSKRKRKSSGF